MAAQVNYQVNNLNRQVKTQTGTIEIDCTRYAGGQYFILMKENDTVIKQSRLLITH